MLAIPRELPPEQYADLLRDYCWEFFVSKGMIADFVIHDKGEGPPCSHPSDHAAMDENGKWLPKCRKIYELDENGGASDSHPADGKATNRRCRLERLEVR